MMESIEKAREAIRKDAFTNANLSEAFGMGGSSEYADTLEGVFNAIEAEIAERYMELPLDADGVPIHYGDSLAYCGEHGGIVTDKVSNMEYRERSYGEADWLVNVSGWIFPSDAHHVKPRTLEDVLYECFHDCMYKYPFGIEPIISKYADELRSMMGVEE